MTFEDFEITNEELDALRVLHPTRGKNSHIGNYAVDIVKLYFKRKYPDSIFLTATKGADIGICYGGKTEEFEIKGTEDDGIAWEKLKVSSEHSYNRLSAGMTLIRVSGIGKSKMKLFFLKHGEHFTLHTEVRYSIRSANKQKRGRRAGSKI